MCDGVDVVELVDVSECTRASSSLELHVPLEPSS